jgi:uncharacterized protein (TIGR02284 family)
MRTQETVRALNRLVRTCRGSEARCRALAASASTLELARLVLASGEEWSRQGDELQALVLLLDARPETRPWRGAGLLRVRLLVSRLLVGEGDSPALAAWEAMQARAVRGYNDALKSYWPERIRRTVRQQAERAERRLACIVSLRGRYALQAHGGRL